VFPRIFEEERLVVAYGSWWWCKYLINNKRGVQSF
jgi:hypothetical protein